MPDADSRRSQKLEVTAKRLGNWLQTNTPRLPGGWVPRRITRAGKPYDQCPTGGPDAIYDHSADGLFLLELFTVLAESGYAEFRAEADRLGQTFISSGGVWGSINHDTYDDFENVAYSCAFRILTRAADILQKPAWRDFARQVALPALHHFQMKEDRNSVYTQGLLWMEESWDTAYLWENAEAAQAFLEAWDGYAEAPYLQTALAILRAIARHHHGPFGFLTEGVDWNNHVSAQHHIHGALYGDIQYTEPLLNNLHLVGPTLFYLKKIGWDPPHGQAALDDEKAIRLVNETTGWLYENKRD